MFCRLASILLGAIWEVKLPALATADTLYNVCMEYLFPHWSPIFFLYRCMAFFPMVDFLRDKKSVYSVLLRCVNSNCILGRILIVPGNFYKDYFEGLDPLFSLLLWFDRFQDGQRLESIRCWSYQTDCNIVYCGR